MSFTCPVVSSLNNVSLGDSGRIKRIRGIAATTRISPQASNRLVESCRSVLNTFIPDIYVYSDVYKGPEAGLSPGFGVSLVAESATGALVHASAIGEAGVTPEEIGHRVSKQLLREIAGGGYFSTTLHYFVLTLMALTVDNVNKVCLAHVHDRDEETMRSIKDFIGVSFKLASQPGEKSVVVSCIGSGHLNFNQRMQ